MHKMSDPIKKAALLLREGATMLPETCPICGSPLYKLKDGRVVCPIHGEIRKIQRTAQQVETKKEVDEVLEDVTDVIAHKLSAVASKAYSGGKDEAEELILWLKALNLALDAKKKLE